MGRSKDSGPRGSAFALTLICAVFLIASAQAVQAGVNVWASGGPEGVAVAVLPTTLLSNERTAPLGSPETDIPCARGT